MIIDGKKKKCLAIALSIILVVSGMITTSANAVKAKIVNPCVLPITKYINAKKLTPLQVYDLLRLIGFKGHDLNVAWAVAMKETHGNPLAHNYNPHTGDNSYGMFQINLYGALKARVESYGLNSAKDLYDPVTNAQIAFKMSSKGSNWVPWGVGKGQRYNGVVKVWIKSLPVT